MCLNGVAENVLLEFLITQNVKIRKNIGSF